MWLHYFLNISATFNSYIWSHWSRDSLSLIGTSKKNFSSKIEFQLYGSNITFKGDFSILILQRSYVLQQQQVNQHPCCIYKCCFTGRFSVFLNGPFQATFSLLIFHFSTSFSKQMLLMDGFKPQSFRVGRKYLSANCVTTFGRFA